MNSSWAMALAVAFRRGTASGYRGGIVDNHQDVFVSPGRLRQRPHYVHPDALEGHLYDGQWNQRAGGRSSRGRFSDRWGRPGRTVLLPRPTPASENDHKCVGCISCPEMPR